MTFSKSLHKTSMPTKQAVGEDYIKKIENCKNYQVNALKDPSFEIKSGNCKTLVFKKEVDSNYIYYEYWEKGDVEPTYFTICISIKDKQLDSIQDEYGYNIPVSALRVSSDNELQITSYDRCRPF